MIVIYPALMSGDVSPNVIPGICKALEKYLLVYGIDSILKVVNIQSKFSKIPEMVKVVRGRLVSEQIQEAEPFNPPRLPDKEGGHKRDPLKPPTPSPAPLPFGDKDKGKVYTKVERPKVDSLSVEPTWVEITTPKKGLQILGVKVVPFPVRSTKSLLQLMADDRERKFLNYMLTKYSRIAIRMFFAVCRSLKVPVIKSRALTGEIKQDILWGTTQYGRHTFCIFNQMDISGETFGKTPKLIQKLHKLGWASFIIADDSSKQSTFCMKEFGGLCSVTNYGFLFASLSRGHAEVYKNLEDVRRSAGPMWRTKINRKKLLGDQIAHSKMLKFSSLVERNELLKEDLASFLKSFTPDKSKKILRSLSSDVKSNDKKKLKKSLSSIPKVPLSRVMSFCGKISPNFGKSYKLCRKVLKNSVSLSDELESSVACIVALGSTYKVDDYEKKTKKNIVSVVTKLRSKSRIEDDIFGVAEIITLTLAVTIASIATIAVTGIGIAKATTAGILALLAGLPTSLVVALVIVIGLVLLAWISRDM